MSEIVVLMKRVMFIKEICVYILGGFKMKTIQKLLNFFFGKRYIDLGKIDEMKKLGIKPIF